MQGATQFFVGDRRARPMAITPGAFYGQTQPAFFFLIGMFGGSSIQMQMIQKMYGEVMHEVDQMIGVLDRARHPVALHRDRRRRSASAARRCRSTHRACPAARSKGSASGQRHRQRNVVHRTRGVPGGGGSGQAPSRTPSRVCRAAYEECVGRACQDGQAAFCDTDAVSDFFDKIEGAMQRGAGGLRQRAHAAERGGTGMRARRQRRMPVAGVRQRLPGREHDAVPVTGHRAAPQLGRAEAGAWGSSTSSRSRNWLEDEGAALREAQPLFLFLRRPHCDEPRPGDDTKNTKITKKT